MSPINRAIVCVHYDRDDIVDEYVYHYLKELKENASHLVFVSTAKLSQNAIDTLTQYCSEVIVRENIGYDFMSYKVGLESFNYREYDEVLICNDSVYGPLYPLKNLFASMQTKKCDFWGITDNTDMAYHLQSYFFVVNKKVLSSTAFNQFWDNVIILNNKDDIILKYEVGFTQTLLNHGFTPAVATTFQPSKFLKIGLVLKKFTPLNTVKKLFTILSGKSKIMRIGKINNAHYFWKDLLIAGDLPFIKIELLRDNPMNVDINNFAQEIQNVSDYDTTLIENHLSRMSGIK